MADDTLCEDERPETIFHILVVACWVWQSGVQRWRREYAGRALDGTFIATSRGHAEMYPKADYHRAEKDCYLASKALYNPSATPWKIVRVKVTVKRKMRSGLPKEGDFAGLPGLLTLHEYAAANGYKPV